MVSGEWRVVSGEGRGRGQVKGQGAGGRVKGRARGKVWGRVGGRPLAVTYHLLLTNYDTCSRSDLLLTTDATYHMTTLLVGHLLAQ